MDVVCNQRGEVVAGVHFADDGADEPGKNQDGNRAEHRRYALTDGFGIVGGLDGAERAEDDGEYAASTAEHQRSVYIGIFKRAQNGKGFACLRTCVNHGGNGGCDQHQNRDNQRVNPAFRAVRAGGFVMGFLQCRFFKARHRADVERKPCDDKHHDQREQGVIIHQAHGDERTHRRVSGDMVGNEQTCQRGDNRCAPA